MLSSELENCLNDAFHRAREARHEYLTVEHLLLGIVDAAKVREILGRRGADLAQLRQELQDHLDRWTPRLEQSDEREVQPTIGFQRVLQRAVFQVQSSAKKEVGAVNVLLAVFSEKQSQAVYLLNHYHVTRADVVKYIRHDARESVGQSAGAIVPVAGRTLRLAKLLGPALIGITVTAWINWEVLAVAAGPALAAYVYLSGTSIFLAGLATVWTHNIWSRHWTVLITLVGWFAVIAGLGCMAAPFFLQRTGPKASVLYGSLLALFSIGIVLTLKAYKRPTR